MKTRFHTAPLFVLAMLTTLPATAQRYGDGPGFWHSNFGWGHMLFGGFMMILVLGAAIVLIVLLVRSLRSPGSSSTPERQGRNSAVDILDERYARGEIDREEYQQRRQDLTR